MAWPAAAMRSLGTKFIALVIAVLVAILTVVTYVYMNVHERQLTESLLSKGTALGRFVSLIAPQPIMTYDFEGMNDFMREVSREEDVVYGVLVASNEITLTHYLDDQNSYVRAAKTASGQQRSDRLLALIEKNPEIRVLHFPIISDGHDIGEFRLGMSTKRIDAEYGRTLETVLLGYAVLLVLISGGIYIGFRHMALGPIANLSAALREVGAGITGKRLAVSSSDEVGSLTASFNAMAGQLDESNRERDRISAQLELKAAELEQLNNDLQRRVTESAHIMRDLHDDVGAKLLTLAHLSDNTSNAETARSALQTLRETIRGLKLEEVTIDLVDALADWRAEAAERLEAASISLVWEQKDDLSGVTLNNRQQINLGRVVREAISNAIRHAQPSVIGVDTESGERELIISVWDDGPQTDPSQWMAGTGINNMRRRATELGGRLRLAAGGMKGDMSVGAYVEVRCPLKETG